MTNCFFIGHRDAADGLFPMIEAEVERCVAECGIDVFIVGLHGRFDSMAARAVCEVKKRHSNVRLLLLLSHIKNEPLPKGFDGAIYPEGLEYVPKRLAILRANLYMVDRCDYIIAHVKRHFGGAWQGLVAAQRKKKHIVNILYIQ